MNDHLLCDWEFKFQNSNSDTPGIFVDILVPYFYARGTALLTYPFSLSTYVVPYCRAQERHSVEATYVGIRDGNIALVPRGDVCRYCRYLQCISTVIYSGLSGHIDRMTQQLSKTRLDSVSSACWDHITSRRQAQVERIMTTLPVSKVRHCVRVVSWRWSSRVKKKKNVRPVSYSLS